MGLIDTPPTPSCVKDVARACGRAQEEPLQPRRGFALLSEPTQPALIVLSLLCRWPRPAHQPVPAEEGEAGAREDPSPYGRAAAAAWCDARHRVADRHTACDGIRHRAACDGRSRRPACARAAVVSGSGGTKARGCERTKIKCKCTSMIVIYYYIKSEINPHFPSITTAARPDLRIAL